MHLSGAFGIEMAFGLARATFRACCSLFAIELVAVIYDGKPSCDTMGGFADGAAYRFRAGGCQQSRE